MHVQNSHYGSGIRRILSPVVSVFWKEEFDVSLLFHALKQTKNNTNNRQQNILQEKKNAAEELHTPFTINEPKG